METCCQSEKVWKCSWWFSCLQVYVLPQDVSWYLHPCLCSLDGPQKGRESKGIGYCSVVKADKNLQMQIKSEVENIESSPNIVPLRKPGTTLQGSSLALSYVSSFEQEYSSQDRDDVDSKVVRCLCANGIPSAFCNYHIGKKWYWQLVKNWAIKVHLMREQLPSY